MENNKLPIKIELPSSFFEEEERDGYVVSKGMKKIWAVLFDLLSEFIRVCDKYNIRWYADGGTILGAVRHKGMIPWDDDIDVMMMRSEYERFLREAKDEFKHPYFLQTEQTDKGSIRGHAQLRNSLTTGILKSEQYLNCPFNQGLFVDIFPIDNIPDSDDEINNLTSEILKYKKLSRHLRDISLCYRYHFRKNIFLSVKHFIQHVMYQLYFKKTGKYIYEEAYSRYESLLTSCIDNQSKYVAKLVMCPYKPRRKWMRSWFDDVEYLTFEFFNLPVPKGYVELLDVFYGDWRTFKMGTATHGGLIADVEKPYKKSLEE